MGTWQGVPQSPLWSQRPSLDTEVTVGLSLSAVCLWSASASACPQPPPGPLLTGLRGDSEAHSLGNKPPLPHLHPSLWAVTHLLLFTRPTVMY